jgi:D-alanyl-D-alanine carboxypeptidase
MNDSAFFNSMGLDPQDIKAQANEINVSTGLDLVKLTKEIIFNQPEVLQIIALQEEPLYLENGVFHHTLKNTNELLGKNPYIVGGKTGLTEKAGGCLLLILKTNTQNEYIVNVILGSGDRFGEMETVNNCALWR